MIQHTNIHGRAGILGSKLNVGLVAHLGAPILADPDRIVVAVDWADDAELTIAAQPDTPRNITADLTDANATVDAGILTVTGLDPEGNVISEVIGFAAALAGFVGTKIFASITNAKIEDANGAEAGVDQFTVGVGDVIGLPSAIAASAQVRDVFLAAVRVAAPVISTGVSRSGIDVSAATYDGTKQLRAYYTPGLASTTS